MSDVAESSSPSPIPLEENSTPISATPAKKGKASKSKENPIKKPSTKPNHPATSELVLNAIKTLEEKNGSSLQAIKKFIVSHYKLDTEKLAPFIKKFLKNAVTSGKLIQTKGKGASGSFKLPAAKPSGEKKKKLAKPKSADKKSKTDKKEKKKKTTPAKTLSEKKKHASSKKGTAKSSAPIKSAAPKQKSTKPSKVASKVKAPKTKKAPSAKKATASGTEKKAAKNAK